MNRLLTQANPQEDVAVQLSALNDQVANLKTDGTILWLLVAGYIVIFMQAGFMCLESGCARAINVKSVIYKNFVDISVGCLVWWAVGFPFAYGLGGEHSNPFIGHSGFFQHNYNAYSEGGARDQAWETGSEMATWFFQFAFAAATSTIVSGATAERIRLGAYLIVTICMTGFIYPVVVHWVWSGSGFLSAFSSRGEEIGNLGLIDFAGSGVVHMTGGIAAMVGAYLLGPRIGRFKEGGEASAMKCHSTLFAAFGGFILWLGWYGFNSGSTLVFYKYMGVAAKVTVTTTLSAASGGVCSLLVHFFMTGVPDVLPIVNGVLAGLVAITAPCSTCEPWAAVVIGAVSAPVWWFSSKLLRTLQIDDVVDAGPVHGFTGVWGLLAAGLFATPTNTQYVYGMDDDFHGGFYGGDGRQFAMQLLGVMCIVTWVGVCSGIVFGALYAAGYLRVPMEQELIGMDESHHGGKAWNFEDKRSSTSDEGAARVEA